MERNSHPLPLWLHHGYSKLLTALCSGATLIAVTLEKNAGQGPSVQDTGSWTAPLRALEGGTGLSGKPTSGFRCPRWVDLVPETCVKRGEFSQQRSMRGGKHVDAGQGGGLPSGCLVGTDIRLQTGDEAAC